MKESLSPPSMRAGFAASVGAIASSLLTLACCLPLGLLGAAGVAAAAVVFASLRPWLLLISAGLLAVGVYQLYRGSRCGLGAGKLPAILLALAAVVFVLVVLFPQVVAGWLADWL